MVEREKQGVQIKEKHQEKRPLHPSGHWVSKLVSSLTGKKEEHVAILASGWDGSSNDANEKILEIPVITNSTGHAQKDAFIKCFSSWNLLDNLIALVFDTTSSNTGWKNGCAALVEKEVGHALLWTACRHHVYELHVRHVWDAVNGSHNGPIEPILKMLQDIWDSISPEPTDITKFDWPEENHPIHRQATIVLNWASRCLEENIFPRADYQELIELTVHYLGGDLPKGKMFNFKKPGAHHRARFMHNELYILKLVMLDQRITSLDLD